MTVRRSASERRIQLPISVSVRPQPMQRPLTASMTQTLMHGERMATMTAGGAQASAATPMRNVVAAICWQAPSVSPVRPPIAEAEIRVKA